MTQGKFSGGISFHVLPSSSLRAEGGGPDPDPCFAIRTDEPVDARAILMGGISRGEPIIEPHPGEAAVNTFGHGAGGSAVVDAPDHVDCFAIRHQQGGGMPLVGLFGPGGDDNMAILLS
jgi:hypothetical protein